MKYSKALLKLILPVTLIYSVPTFASARDADALPEVLEYIESEQYEKAYELINNINYSLLEEGVVGIVHNLAGTVLIELNQGQAALDAFNHAEAAGYDNPILDYNRGRAHLIEGELDPAITLLERYTAADPKSAKAFRSLGRAYFEMNDLEQASSAFKQAVALDPDQDVSYFYLARIAYAQHQYQAAADLLGFLSTNNFSSDLDAEIDQARENPEPESEVTEEPAIFSGWATVSMGRNSNVIGLANGAPTPADINDEGDTQSQFGLGLNWRAYDEGGKLIQLGYWLDAQKWSDLDQFDTTTHGLQGIYSQWINEGLLGSAVIGLSSTDLDSENYLDSNQIQLGLRKQISEHRQIGGLFSYTDQDFTHPSLTAANNRNGKNSSVGIYWNEQLHGWNTSSEFRFINSSTSGANFDSSGYMINFSANRALPELALGEQKVPLHFSAYFGYSKSNYDRINTLSTVKRSDSSIQLSASLSSAFRKNWSAEIRISHLKNNSNITFYEFDRNNIRLGVTRTF